MPLPLALLPVVPTLKATAGFVRTWWKAGIGAVAGAVLAFPLGQCSGAHQERAEIRAKQAEAALRQEVRNASAAQAAAVERMADHSQVATAEKERNDAIAAAPAGRASDAELALACRRLRQQGVRPARLPANCGPERPAQAPAQH